MQFIGYTILQLLTIRGHVCYAERGRGGGRVIVLYYSIGLTLAMYCLYDTLSAYVIDAILFAIGGGRGVRAYLNMQVTH